MRPIFTAACMFSLALAQSAAAEPSVKELAARAEVRAIETLNVSDQQFLTGDKNGKPVAIAGELRLPQGATGRLPAVILMHGSGGPGAREEFWAKIFNEMGIASFRIDSFSGRGLTSVSTNQALLGRFNMILDAYRAHGAISAHPRIDRGRIALMGFSRGGQTALYASLKRFQQAWDPEVAFAAYIPLYASCNATLIGDTDVSAVPIRMFHGIADDYVPVAPCRAYVERLRGAGRDVRLTEFADAHHAYDNPLGSKTPTVSKGAQSVRACKLKEEPLGTIINAETGQPFTYKDPCVATDPHVGHNEAAMQATHAAVKEVLRGVFKLN
ncbi:MAG TPA: dienelactone hydrolase family protein [Xanthobacteraceae bacterium]|nr:dienelactone hydrolase family protein [Xanthobacteraceae bacterium]